MKLNLAKSEILTYVTIVKEKSEMYNKELFQKVVKCCGMSGPKPVTDEGIKEAQEQLGVRFPSDYISFIKKYGEVGIPGAYIFGINGDYYTVAECTKQFREQFHIPKEYVVVTKRSDRKRAWLICLDTSRMQDGLCPAVLFDRKTSEITEYTKSFDEVVDKEMLRLYLTRVKPEEEEQTEKRIFPAGMGYKSVWMVIKGSTQAEIASRLLTEEGNSLEYRAGLEVVKTSEDKALVTADYEGKNYVILPLTQEYFDRDWVERNCADFPECYMFLTERVSETHGFMKAVNGELVRYYLQDEEGIIDIGKPLVEEQMTENVLPHNLEEYRLNLKEKTKTILNEDTIIALALEAGSVEEYPYADVMVGELVK